MATFWKFCWIFYRSSQQGHYRDLLTVCLRSYHRTNILQREATWIVLALATNLNYLSSCLHFLWSRIYWFICYVADMSCRLWCILSNRNTSDDSFDLASTDKQSHRHDFRIHCAIIALSNAVDIQARFKMLKAQISVATVPLDGDHFAWAASTNRS